MASIPRRWNSLFFGAHRGLPKSIISSGMPARRNLLSTISRRPNLPVKSRLSQQRRYAERKRPAVLIGHDPIPPTRREWQELPRSRKVQFGVVGPVLLACLFYWYNLETVPVSGRTRFNCMKESLVDKFGEMQFKMLLKELQSEDASFLPEWDPRSRMVMRVMKKIIPVSGMEDKRWDIMIVDAPEIPNAAVMPGGKVIVFSGIFRFIRNDSALAAVLGHEVAHNLAGHVAERMSGNIGFNVVLVGSLFLFSWLAPLGLYFFGRPLLEFVNGKPMSRAQEYEADYIGLMMMSEACYDPREAQRFWAIMHHATQNEPPEILNTHPSHKHRMEKLEEWMPQALEKRAQSECTGTSHFADMLRRAFEQGYIIVTT